MKLSTRLLLLILGCMLPILAAQLYTAVQRNAERHAQLAETTRYQAERSIGELSAIIDGIRRIATVAAHWESLHTTGPGCVRSLETLRADIDNPRFLAVVNANGQLLCARTPALTALWTPPPDWLPNRPTGNASVLGSARPIPGLEGLYLPIAVRIARNNGTADTLIAGLDLAGLAGSLTRAAARLDNQPGNTTLFVADRDGNVIARFPPAAADEGALPASLRPLLALDHAGVVTLSDNAGGLWLASHVPSPMSASGVTAIAVVAPPDPIAYLGNGSVWDLLVTGSCAMIALMLAWLAGRRFIYVPTEMLLRTAQRWRDGDLNVRAALTEGGSEFGKLAQSFNAMASSLQARDLERRLQAELLESLVVQRTRALSEINNRLQVEVAEREKTEAALHQAQKLQAVGQLAGGIAHDFNNMLATVLGNLELMQHRVEQLLAMPKQTDLERLTALIERATGAVQRGAQLTSRLLAFSRRQRLSTRPTDLNRLVAELVTLATSTLGRRVRVITDLAPDLWPALIDPSQVEAAILNLCLNARDAMPDGGQLTITTANEMLEAGPSADDPAPGPYVRVMITDTGHGMAPEVRRQAFDPFFTTKGPGGSGLGLSQVYGMARQSGGTVRLESTEGMGTSVALLLPRAASDEETNAPVRQPANRRLEMGTLFVMVVDDDAAVRLVAVEMLRDLGCTVVQAPGGAEALDMLPGLPREPDFFLVDYAMPGMNGLRLATSLREHGVTAAIALVTGYAELADSDMESSPLDGLLRKPFTIRELRALLVSLHKLPGPTSVPVPAK